MRNVIVFPLFARDGFVNPTPWPTPGELPHERYGPAFFDMDTGKWHAKQGPSFDSGWRWFRSDTAATLSIYNKLFDPRAYADITDEEIEDSVIGPEFVLHCAKVRCLVEHNCCTMSNYLQDRIERMFSRAREEMFDG